ncbi:uncharacterized protein JCM15063_005265 [Sporobolomyces koalae]|uniref:uncharacterized protein n=1 Tax=Sporobolomyces koalae TaxID=500713 RepID=UPI0031803160
MASNIVGISPLSPASKLDGWETPSQSTMNSPVPTKCCDLPDFEPSVPRNHQRSKDSQWNTSGYPKEAPPLPKARTPTVVVQAPMRPKPIRLATPNTGYPFPYVLSRPVTPSEPPSTFSPDDSEPNSPASSRGERSSASLSDASSTRTCSSTSPCRTPPDAPPAYSPARESAKSGATTPYEVQQRRTKNAANTPGNPPPMGFVGLGHAYSTVDFEDVKRNEVEQQEHQRPETPTAKLANPLIAKLQGLAVAQETQSN